MDESRKFWFLFTAYTIVWLLMGGYLLWLGIRQRHNRRQIERLRAQIGDTGENPSRPASGRQS